MFYNFFLNLTIIILLYFGVNVLFRIGWDVESNSVSVYEATLPAAYCLALLFIYNILTENKKKLLSTKKEEFALLTTIVALILFQKVMGQTGFFSTIMNCLIMPVLLSSLISTDIGSLKFRNTTSNTLRILSKTTLVFYVVECLWAILERVFQYNVFPFSTGNRESLLAKSLDVGEFRSTALINHPLQNALAVSIVMSFVLTSSIKSKYKYLLWGLGFMAILSFNTRSSIFGWIILFSIYLFHTIFRNKKKSIREKLTLVYFSFSAIVVAGILMISLNWGQRLFRLGLDDSSAKTRLQILKVFDNYNITEFLWGFSQSKINRITYQLDVSIIENFWIIYIFRYGLIFTSLLIILFGKLFSRLLNGYSSFNRIFVLLSFIAIGSTNNSLAVASPVMCIFILCCYIFNPRLKVTLITK